MGYKNAAPEAFINYLGYDALLKKQYNRAEALFQLNIENYPNSNNVYDSYGDYLIAKHDSINAVTYYKKALSIKNDVAPKQTNCSYSFTKISSFISELEKYAGVYILETYKIEVNLEIGKGSFWQKFRVRKMMS